MTARPIISIGSLQTYAAIAFGSSLWFTFLHEALGATHMAVVMDPARPFPEPIGRFLVARKR